MKETFVECFVCSIPSGLGPSPNSEDIMANLMLMLPRMPKAATAHTSWKKPPHQENENEGSQHNRLEDLYSLNLRNSTHNKREYRRSPTSKYSGKYDGRHMIVAWQSLVAATIAVGNSGP